MRYTLAVVSLIAVSASVVAGAQNQPRQELKEITPDKVDSAVYQRLAYRLCLKHIYVPTRPY